MYSTLTHFGLWKGEEGGELGVLDKKTLLKVLANFFNQGWISVAVLCLLTLLYHLWPYNMSMVL